MGKYSDNLFRQRSAPKPAVQKYAPYGPGADPAKKGIRGGNCNRTACQHPGANYWHTGTNAWYCIACTREINRVNSSEAMKLYGIPYLIACPYSISADEREAWKAKGITIPEKL